MFINTTCVSGRDADLTAKAVGNRQHQVATCTLYVAADDGAQGRGADISSSSHGQPQVFATAHICGALPASCRSQEGMLAAGLHRPCLACQSLQLQKRDALKLSMLELEPLLTTALASCCSHSSRCVTQAKQQGKEGLGAVMQAMSDEKQSDKGPPEVAVVHAEGLILVGMPSTLCHRCKHDLEARTLRSPSTGRSMPTCHSVIPVDNRKPDCTLPDMRHGALPN
jgi:hypothetical protein